MMTERDIQRLNDHLRKLEKLRVMIYRDKHRHSLFNQLFEELIVLEIKYNRLISEQMRED